MITFLPENGIRNYIDEQLIQFGFNYNDKLTTDENLKAVFALQRRIPSQEKRLVIELPEVEIPKGFEKAYYSIIKKLSLGITIKPYLSMSTTKYTYNDLLLNSWNIHHLHLSTEPFKKGFFKRTGPVLFCMFFEKAVIIIDILTHGVGHSDVWVNEQLIKKLHLYLPESLEQYKVKGITGNSLNSEQRKSLQKNHCNYAMKMEDGTVYQLIGVMTNGDSFHDIKRLMHVRRTIDYFSQVIKADEKAFEQSLEIKGNEKVTLTIAFIENHIKLYCPDKKTIININEPV